MSQNSKLTFQEKIPSFIRKTYEILEENRFPDIIDWSKDEKALVIFKPADFASQVLPLYFKHNHLTSFVRQLHMYNFHKRRAVGNDHIYYHELFQKNKKYLLKNIRKKKSDQNQDQSPSLQALENARRMGNNDESATLSHENENLKKMHEDALSKINSLEQKIKELTQQNQSLWNQLSPQNNENNFLAAEKSVSQTFFNNSYDFQPSKNFDDVFADLPVFSDFLNCDEHFGDGLETASQSYISSQLSPSDNYDAKGYFAQGKQSAKMSDFQLTPKKETKPAEGIKITFGTWSLASNNFRSLSVNNNTQSPNLLCKREFQESKAFEYELEHDQFSKMNKPRKLLHTSQNYFESAPESMSIF